MAVQRVAEVLHHAEAHQVREVGLPDADRPGDDRDGDHNEQEVPRGGLTPAYDEDRNLCPGGPSTSLSSKRCSPTF